MKGLREPGLVGDGPIRRPLPVKRKLENFKIYFGFENVKLTALLAGFTLSLSRRTK